MSSPRERSQVPPPAPDPPEPSDCGDYAPEYQRQNNRARYDLLRATGEQYLELMKVRLNLTDILVGIEKSGHLSNKNMKKLDTRIRGYLTDSTFRRGFNSVTSSDEDLSRFLTDLSFQEAACWIRESMNECFSCRDEFGEILDQIWMDMGRERVEVPKRAKRKKTRR